MWTVVLPDSERDKWRCLWSTPGGECKCLICELEGLMNNKSHSSAMSEWQSVLISLYLAASVYLPFMIISFRLYIYIYSFGFVSPLECLYVSHPHLINWPPPFLYFPVHCSASATLWALRHPVMIHAPVPSSFIAALVVNSTLSCRIVFVCRLALCMSADIGGCWYYYPSAWDHMVCAHCCGIFLQYCLPV